MALEGGDSLEENFILGDDDSQSEYTDPSSASKSQDHSDSESSIDSQEPEEQLNLETPPAKKAKLNWREWATLCLGSPESQASLIQSAITAFTTYFPNDASFSADSDLSSLCFLDCEEFAARSEKSVRDMLEFFRAKGYFSSAEQSCKGLNTLIISGSATRAMYIVKELREFDSKLAPLPLFFHGGGRKKEQGSTHEAVLRGNKTSVAVCLPSRLKAALENNLIDFKSVTLVIFDLKTNEKKLNVLSQKDSLKDVLSIIIDYIAQRSHEDMKIALI